MTGLVRKATLLTFCGLLGAGAAMAGVPSAATSTLPPGNCIRLVGRNLAGAADPLGTFTITVRDLASNPVAGANLTLDFQQCPDIHMADQTLQPAGTTVNAGLKQVSKTTDALGQVTFTLVGGAANGGSGGATLFPGSGFGCCKVIAGGSIILGNLGVAAFDQNNVGGINAADTAEMIGDTFNPGPAATYAYRSNVNCSTEAFPPGPVNASDTSYEIARTFGTYTFSATLNAW